MVRGKAFIWEPRPAICVPRSSTQMRALGNVEDLVVRADKEESVESQERRQCFSLVARGCGEKIDMIYNRALLPTPEQKQHTPGAPKKACQQNAAHSFAAKERQGGVDKKKSQKI
jgi:hypothetical protein